MSAAKLKTHKTHVTNDNAQNAPLTRRVRQPANISQPNPSEIPSHIYSTISLVTPLSILLGRYLR